MKDIIIPYEVAYVLDKLGHSGFEAFVAGGCVRDSLMGRVPEDWDVTTSALPSEIKALFEKTFDTGIKHGTVTILIGGMSIEATTFRVDGIYEDNRRPSEVRFSNSLAEDLSRRDFTMNSIAYSPNYGFIDPFKGIDDIKRKIIRTTGEADCRFREDALRMLRAIRFSAQLGYDIDADTYTSVCNNSSLIANISKERIRDELGKILMSDNPDKIQALFNTGLFLHIFPEFLFAEDSLLGIAITAGALKAACKDYCIRWAIFTSSLVQMSGDISGSAEIAKAMLKRLKFDNIRMRKITMLVKYSAIDIEPCLQEVMKIAAAAGKEAFCDVLKVKEAFIMAHNSIDDKKIDDLLIVKEIYKEIISSNYCLSLGCLAVNGRDIMDLGITEGKNIGIVLNRLLDAVIAKPELNEKTILMGLAQEEYKKS